MYVSAFAWHLSALAVAVSCFKVPENSENGVYRAYYGQDGQELYERLADPPNTVHAFQQTGRRHVRREFDDAQTWCGCGQALVQDDMNNAIQALEVQLAQEQELLPLEAFWAINNTVVTFVCSQDYASINYISTADYTAAITRISTACRDSLTPGTAQVWETDTGAVDIGVAAFSANASFCMPSQSEGFKQSSC